MGSASTLSVDVFTAPEKAVIGERPRPLGPLGPPMAWDATTSTLIFGENDAVLIDTLTTIDEAEAEALARWVELHHRNLTTIYVTHMHIDHYGGLSVLLRHFPDARAIATPKTVEPEPYDNDVFTLAGHKKAGVPDTADAIEAGKRYLLDFGRLKESASSEQELYDAMAELYPDWAGHQAWLMFGLG